MTSNIPTPETATHSTADSTPDSSAENRQIPAFRFPFSADTYAPKKDGAQPRYPRDHGVNHAQRPGAAPRGTRRSMGKR